MIIDNALSKGLRKQLQRNASTNIIDRTKQNYNKVLRNNSDLGKLSRKNFIKQHQLRIRHLVGDFLLDEGQVESGKDARGYSLYLQWLGIEDHPGISAFLDLIVMQTRHFTQDEYELPFGVSEHSVQRMIQAINSHSLVEVTRLVKPHIISASLMLLDIKNSPKYNRFYSSDGVSIWKLVTASSKTMHLMKTFIPAKSLEKEHEKLWKKYMEHVASLPEIAGEMNMLWVRGSGEDDMEFISWSYSTLFIT